MHLLILSLSWKSRNTGSFCFPSSSPFPCQSTFRGLRGLSLPPSLGSCIVYVQSASLNSTVHCFPFTLSLFSTLCPHSRSQYLVFQPPQHLGQQPWPGLSSQMHQPCEMDPLPRFGSQRCGEEVLPDVVSWLSVGTQQPVGSQRPWALVSQASAPWSLDHPPMHSGGMIFSGGVSSETNSLFIQDLPWTTQCSLIILL